MKDLGLELPQAQRARFRLSFQACVLRTEVDKREKRVHRLVSSTIQHGTLPEGKDGAHQNYTQYPSTLQGIRL